MCLTFSVDDPWVDKIFSPGLWQSLGKTEPVFGNLMTREAGTRLKLDFFVETIDEFD